MLEASWLITATDGSKWTFTGTVEELGQHLALKARDLRVDLIDS